MFTHPCLKCATTYQDADPDAYYCPTCLTERKKLAAQIDKKMKSAAPTLPTKSEYQAFCEQGKTFNKPDGSTATFMKA